MQKLMTCSVALGILWLVADRTQAGPISGTMYYTTYGGGQNVHKVDYNYNGTSAFVLSNNVNVASTPGADGIVFTSDGFLAVGGQGPTVHRVNPSNGTFVTKSTGGPAAFHMSVAPNGSIIAASIPGAPALFNSTLTNNGTPLLFTGGLDSALNTIVFDKNGQGWYTESGAGGFGNFGKINIDFTLNTYSTIRTMSGVPAAHGAAYDSFSDSIILFGDGHISQVDPYTGGSSLLDDISGFSGTFDQGAVDGKGHIFAANNNGNLTFIDFSSTGNLSTLSYIDTQFLASFLDDVAPLSGLGSNSPVPEPASLTMLCLGTLIVAGCSWKKRRDKTASLAC